MHKKKNQIDRPKDQRRGFERGGDSRVLSGSDLSYIKTNYLFNNCYFMNRNYERCRKKGNLKNVCYLNKNKFMYDKDQFKLSD